MRRLRDLQLPDKVLRRAIAAVLEHALNAPAPPGDADPDADADPAAEGEAPGAGARALCGAACAVVRGVKRAAAGDALRALLHAVHPHPRLPALLAHAVRQVSVADRRDSKRPL